MLVAPLSALLCAGAGMAGNLHAALNVGAPSGSCSPLQCGFGHQARATRAMAHKVSYTPLSSGRVFLPLRPRPSAAAR